jgi:hypothetical protein
MNSEFWNIFQWNPNGFSDRIPMGTVPSPVGYSEKTIELCCSLEIAIAIDEMKFRLAAKRTFRILLTIAYVF